MSQAITEAEHLDLQVNGVHILQDRFYLTFLDNSLTTTRSEESVHESWVLLSIGTVDAKRGVWRSLICTKVQV